MDPFAWLDDFKRRPPSARAGWWAARALLLWAVALAVFSVTMWLLVEWAALVLTVLAGLVLLALPLVVGVALYWLRNPRLWK